MIAGVCGGIAEHFNIDPVIPRIIAVLLLFISFGTAIIVYIILCLIVPEAPASEPKAKKVASAKKDS